MACGDPCHAVTWVKVNVADLKHVILRPERLKRRAVSVQRPGRHTSWPKARVLTQRTRTMGSASFVRYSFFFFGEGAAKEGG